MRISTTALRTARSIRDREEAEESPIRQPPESQSNKEPDEDV